MPRKGKGKDLVVRVSPAETGEAFEREPTAKEQEKADKIRKLALLGLTQEEIAQHFGVKSGTLRKWAKEKPEIGLALRQGGIEADAEVAASMYQRATGYTVMTRKVRKAPVMIAGEQKTLTEETITETHIPAETKAGTVWLFNRDPNRWHDRKATDEDVFKGDQAKLMLDTTSKFEEFMKKKRAQEG